MNAGAPANGKVWKATSRADRGLKVVIDRNFDRWKPFEGKLAIFRVSDGSVFTEDAGFQLLLGQTEDFPLLQVSPFTNKNIDIKEYFSG